MSFIKNVNFLAGIFRTKKMVIELVDEYQNQSDELKEKISTIQEEIELREDELRELVQKEESLNAKILSMELKMKELTQRFHQDESQANILHQLESIEFINSVMKQKEYELRKYDFSSEVDEEDYGNSYAYYKPDFLKIINFKIQEFAAKEGISYEKAKKALYDINAAWFECYSYDEDEEWIDYEKKEAELLMNSFLIPMKIRKR